MHGKPGAVLILAKREHSTVPDFSGPGFVMAKKKMLGHGHDEEEPCPGCAGKMHDEQEGIGEALTTDGGKDEGNYDDKVSEMKQLAQKMMALSDELGQASEVHAEQPEELCQMADSACDEEEK